VAATSRRRPRRPAPSPTLRPYPPTGQRSPNDSHSPSRRQPSPERNHGLGEARRIRRDLPKGSCVTTRVASLEERLPAGPRSGRRGSRPAGGGGGGGRRGAGGAEDK